MIVPSPSDTRDRFGHCDRPELVAAMFQAAERGDAQGMLRAIDAGADTAAQERGHGSLVQAICRGGSLPMLRAALDKGAPLLEHPQSERPCALRSLAGGFGRATRDGQGRLSMAKLLINQGADPEGSASSHWEDCPLAAAAAGDDVEMARLLLTRGANPNRAFRQGMTVLLVACEHGAQRVVDLLLDWSAMELNAWGPQECFTVDDQGENALHKAVASGCSATLIRRLAENGSAVNILNRSGLAPIHEAAWRGQVDLIETLVHLGADVDAAGERGRAPLAMAVEHGQVQTCLELARLGANPDRPCSRGETPRQIARDYKVSDCLAAIEAAETRILLESVEPTAERSRRLAL